MWLIGIDDTDMPDTRGTGRLARMMAAELARDGLRVCGVTRHQLLVHPDVPYTSHNSAACVGIEGAVADRLDWIRGYVRERSPEGADPGVCAAEAKAVGESVMEFGRRAQQEVVTLEEAKHLGEQDGCALAGLGGTNHGMIGALAAVGLRAAGSDGRFIELGRMRHLGERVRVCALKEAGIDAVHSPGPIKPKLDEWVRTFGWIRPRLRRGKAVLLVEREIDDGAEWIVTDRRKGRHGCHN